jgi:hypothetical protein
MARGAGQGLYFVFAGNALRHTFDHGHRLSVAPATGQGSGGAWVFVGVAVLASLLLGVA